MRCLLGLVLLALAGCSHLPAHPALVHLASTVEQPFSLNGRLAVRHAQASASLGLHWEHHPERDEILLLAPLGQTVARIRRDGSGAELRAGDKQYQAEDMESLMEHVLGWHLPMSELHAWVRGMPYPDSAYVAERNEAGQVALLRQDRWEVRYLRYVSEAKDSPPKHLSLRFEDMSLQLLVDEWLEEAP